MVLKISLIKINDFFMVQNIALSFSLSTNIFQVLNMKPILHSTARNKNDVYKISFVWPKISKDGRKCHCLHRK